MNFEIVLDIFSGRPNPTWNLTGALAAELEERLRRLPPAGEHKPPSPPDLGYRGLKTTQMGEDREQAWQHPYHVYGGFVRHADSTFLDKSRHLERWLLAEGGPGVEKNLREELLREL